MYARISFGEAYCLGSCISINCNSLATQFSCNLQFARNQLRHHKRKFLLPCNSLTFRLIRTWPTPSEKSEWMTYDDDCEALKPVCGAFWAPVWACALGQNVERAF